MASGWRAYLEVDLRSILSAIHVPTLVLQTVGNRQVPVGHGRYLAEHIADAQYLELPYDEHHVYLGHPEVLADQIEAFITGVPSRPPSERVLATMVFTDIVDSTRTAATLGDREWTALLDKHDAVVRSQLARYRGVEVNTTGDGFLATFDGPGRAIECAFAIRAALTAIGVSIRTGVHTGEVERRGDDVGGIAVHIANRIAALAGDGEVLVSRTVTDLVAGGDFAFEPRGTHVLKGVPNAWDIFLVGDLRH